MKSRPQLLAREDLPAEPRQQRSADKRRRWKAAGLNLFGTTGYEATSIDAIARRANLAVGGFYQHYQSKRQLLLALMDEFLEKLGEIELEPKAFLDVRSGLRELLAAAFARDLHYLGVYRAWREAALADADLARMEEQIRAWTTSRVRAVFERLRHLPGARPDVDVPTLARVMDRFFWSLLAEAGGMPPKELARWLDTSADLILHALFTDRP